MPCHCTHACNHVCACTAYTHACVHSASHSDRDGQTILFNIFNSNTDARYLSTVRTNIHRLCYLSVKKGLKHEKRGQKLTGGLTSKNVLYIVLVISTNFHGMQAIKNVGHLKRELGNMVHLLFHFELFKIPCRVLTRYQDNN